MALTLGRTRLRAHPLMLLFPLAAARLGAREDAAALLVALAAHEGAHLLAARWMRVGVSQLRLMPFGGAIAVDNPYALTRGQLLAVAAAGPAGNLVALTACAALAHWGAVGPPLALAMMECNLLMLLFNLLPALPLDGGRMLYALLSPRLGRRRAVDIGIWLGRGVAGALVALCLYTGLARGRFNLSFALCAAFIFASAPDERRALGDARAQTLLRALVPLERPAPARLVAVSADCSVRDALRSADPAGPTLYAVLRDGAPPAFTDARQLLEAALDGREGEAVGGIC